MKSIDGFGSLYPATQRWFSILIRKLCGNGCRTRIDETAFLGPWITVGCRLQGQRSQRDDHRGDAGADL
jgi:hypothetical protein